MSHHPIWHRVSWHVSSARFRTRWTWQPWLWSSKVEMLFFWGGGWQFLPLDIQIPPQEKVWMAYFRGPTTFSAGVWMSRVHTLFLHLLLDMASFAQDWDEVDWCSRSMRVTKTDDHRRDPHKSGKSYDAEKTLRMTGWFLKNLEGVLTSFYCHCIISVIFFCCKAFSMGTMGLPNKLKPSFQFTTLHNHSHHHNNTNNHNHNHNDNDNNDNNNNNNNNNKNNNNNNKNNSIQTSYQLQQMPLNILGEVTAANLRVFWRLRLNDSGPPSSILT